MWEDQRIGGGDKTEMERGTNCGTLDDPQPTPRSLTLKYPGCDWPQSSWSIPSTTNLPVRRGRSFSCDHLKNSQSGTFEWNQTKLVWLCYWGWWCFYLFFFLFNLCYTRRTSWLKVSFSGVSRMNKQQHIKWKLTPSIKHQKHLKNTWKPKI